MTYEYFVEVNTPTVGDYSSIEPMVKRRVIVNALDKCGGNYPLAAHLLGIGKTTIQPYE